MKRFMNLKPSKTTVLFLGLMPFLIIWILYTLASDLRLAENPNDKLLPSFTSCLNSMKKMAFTPSKRTGELLFAKDTTASLQRLGMGILLSAILALFISIALGFIPLIRALFSPFVAAFSLVPPLAILPILFIIFGMGEISKVALIVIGVTPLMIRDLQQRVLEIPVEQIIKAQTLGGSSWNIIIRIVLPQIFPRLLDSVRLTLGAAWIFLISAEAISATNGLGYRIFLMSRYMSMDIILPYVAWITFLAFLFDFTLKRVTYKLFPWYKAGKDNE